MEDAAHFISPRSVQVLSTHNSMFSVWCRQALVFPICVVIERIVFEGIRLVYIRKIVSHPRRGMKKALDMFKDCDCGASTHTTGYRGAHLRLVLLLLPVLV
jgi:hypothetical protein